VILVSNFPTGLVEGMAVLRKGGSCLDAVEAAIRVTEDDPNEHSVGYSGYPNLLGQVELDACIMDGTTLEAGAVAGLSWCRNPISVARKVMEELPHVLLVGEGADRFAKEMGFPRQSLLTPEIRAAWRKRLVELVGRDGVAGLPRRRNLRSLVGASTKAAHDTVNVLAVDRGGAIVAGVSTSGWAWKYPGRVGDSAVIGAGGYADSRYGAAACTGRGEMAIRACASKTVVANLKAGMSLRDACAEAMKDMAALPDKNFSWVDIIAVDRTGNLIGCSWKPDRVVHYFTETMKAPGTLPMVTLECIRPAGR